MTEENRFQLLICKNYSNHMLDSLAQSFAFILLGKKQSNALLGLLETDPPEYKRCEILYFCTKIY